MKTITLDDIHILSPCYNPNKYVGSEWDGKEVIVTLIEFLNNQDVPVIDKLWVILREQFVSQDTLNAFSDYCGGGLTPIDAAKNQIANAVADIQYDEEDEDCDMKQNIIITTQNAQIEKLIQLIELEDNQGE